MVMARGGRWGSWGFADFGARPNAAERRSSGARAAADLTRKGRRLAPVRFEGRRNAIALTFWGKAWCENLERYGDHANRLPRGRTYVRTGAVIDLQIETGKVAALVQGSSLYEVAITIEAVPAARWQQLVRSCAGGIDSVIELLEGKLSSAVMTAMTHPVTGLFPEPRRIAMVCSCPDSARMCKHVAAVLYGIGARLDHAPELLFRLRGADPTDLVARAASSGITSRGTTGASRALVDVDLASVFGIELAAAPEESPPAAPAPPAAPSPSAALRHAAVQPAAVQPAVVQRRAARRRTLARADLLGLGVTPGTLRGWLDRGILETTEARGVYGETPEARRLLRPYRRR